MHTNYHPFKKGHKSLPQTNRVPSSLVGKKLNFSITQTITKMKKDRPVQVDYELGSIPISYTVKGVVHSLWLIISRNKKHLDFVICSLRASYPMLLKQQNGRLRDTGCTEK
jgi:hypothetical protein